MSAATGRRLLLWRHGLTEQNAGGIYQGHLDSDLSPVGIAQARAAAVLLAAEQPDLLWSSDLRRAAHTAEELALLTGLPVRYDARLREIDVGQWQGMSHGDVVAAYPADTEALERGEDLRRGVHGETVAEVAHRTRAAVQDLLTELPPGGTGVIASHGLACRALAAALVGMDQNVAWLTLAGMRNCHWSELAEQRTGWRMVSWNAGALSTPEAESDR